MTKRSRRVNGVVPDADKAAAENGRDKDVVRSAISGRFIISEAQAKKLEALKAQARKPTALPHGF